MKVMVIVKASADSEAGKLPTQQLLADMMQFNDQLVKAGILLAADGLKPSSAGVRVRFSGTSRSVTAGPFTETNELVAGFWLWQVKSLDEAIAWVKRCPNPMLVDSDIEIRPLFEPADFGPALTPELAQQEQQMRDHIEQRQLDPPRFERGRELLLAGYQQTYSFETRSGIPAQWARFVPHLGKIPGQVGSTTYGVSWNYQPGQGFDYLSGVEVSAGAPLAEGFSQLKLAPQDYAVFTHRGHFSAIPATLEAIWKAWLPNSGREAAAAPCFERYSEEFNPQTGMGGTEIWLPLKS